MKYFTRMTKLTLAAAIASALIATVAQAGTNLPASGQDGTKRNAANQQVTPPQQSSKEAKSSKSAQTLSEVVVTGAPTFNGVTRAEASFSITTVDRQQIKIANPVSIADLLKLSPGVYSESSGGQTGANVEVAGFPSDSGAPFVTFDLEGMPLFPRWAYFEDAMVRLDDTISHVEMLQGGPSVLYGTGQPGLIANFRLRQGTDVPSGDVGVTWLSEGGVRLDGFYGFPLGGDWYGSIGGFWRKSDGVRDPQFPADKGGQVTMTLSHSFENGSILFYARMLKDHNQFVTDTPLLNPAPGKFSPWPGFDPLTGTFGSRADQHQTWQIAPCFKAGCTPKQLHIDLANGRGGSMHVFGSTLNLYLNDTWTFSNKLQFVGGYFDTEGSYFSTGDNPESLSQFIAGTISDFDLPPNLVATARYTTGGAPSMDEMVTVQNPEYIHKHPQSLSDEFRFSKQLTDTNTLTFGSYIAVYSDRHIEQDGLMHLLQAKSNPTPIAVTLSDGTTTYELTNSQGLFHRNPQTWMALFAKWHATKIATFLTDQWSLGKWRLAGGLRVEHDKIDGRYQGKTTGDLDADPTTLYNNHSEYLIDTFTHHHYSKSAPSWTLGATYTFTDHMSAYGRVNDGVFMPGFGDVRSDPDVPVEKIHNMEVGFKYQAPWVLVDVSAYKRLFRGIPYQFQQANGGLISLLYGSNTKGVNLQGVIRPFDHFSIVVNANYMNGHYARHQGCVPFTAQDGSTQCAEFNGKRLSRQPKVQYRLTPIYTVPTSWGKLKFWVNYEHVGDRFGDQIEQQPLGSYYDIGIGARADIGDHWNLTLRGTNVTDQIGVTEGNARLFGFASTGGVILARSIKGHEYNFQVKYNF